MGDDGCIVRFMHEFGLMVSTRAVGMASHSTSALWERWFNYCEGSWRSVPRVRHQTDSYLRGSLVKEICAHFSWWRTGAGVSGRGLTAAALSPVSHSGPP